MILPRLAKTRAHQHHVPGQTPRAKASLTKPTGTLDEARAAVLRIGVWICAAAATLNQRRFTLGDAATVVSRAIAQRRWRLAPLVTLAAVGGVVERLETYASAARSAASLGSSLAGVRRASCASCATCAGCATCSGSAGTKTLAIEPTEAGAAAGALDPAGAAIATVCR